MASPLVERLEERLLDTYEQPAEREGFTVETQDQAAWASRRAAAAHRKMDEISAWEAREVERIRAAAAAERKQYERDAEYFAGLLAQYVMRLQAEGSKKKSVKLPGGTIALRSRQPKLEIHDEAAAIEMLRGTSFVKVEEKLAKGDLKKQLERTDDGQWVLKSTGEVVEWAALVEQEDSINFTPAEEDEE